ncbi:MAG: spore maturation protein [Cellulosilyticaceae bacterium]
MKFLLALSDFMMPCVMLFIICYALFKGINVFEAFISGAKEGINVVLSILPTLVGLLLAVGMLRASGGLDGIVRLISPLLQFTNFPTEAVPIALLRTFSSSASMGLVVDIFKNFGPDSFLGQLVSVIAGCTESIFYTLSIYFMSVHIKNTRYTVVVALLASLTGIIVAYQLSCHLFGI